MSKLVGLLSVLALSLFLGPGQAWAQEEKIPKEQIPKAVMDALLAKFPKAKIDTCVREKEGGAVVYDIEVKQEGRHCEADIREDGPYINYEKSIPAKDLPRAVRSAIEKKYPKATLKEVMEETEVKGREEMLSAYEVVLMTADKKSVEVRVSP